MNTPENEDAVPTNIDEQRVDTTETIDGTNIADKAAAGAFVPHFNDLGKDARDVLTKIYNYGFILFGFHKRTDSGADFEGGVTYVQQANNFVGYLASKYVYDSDYEISGRWNAKKISRNVTMADNSVLGMVSVKDTFLKLSAECLVDPTTGYVTGQIKSAFQDERASFSLATTLTEGGPLTIDSSVVVDYKGMLFGYQTTLDTDISRLTQSIFALQYSTGMTTCCFCANNNGSFGGLVYSKLSESVKTAVQVDWSRVRNAASACMGLEYNHDAYSTFWGSLNNEFGLGLAFRQRCTAGITITVCALIDCKNYMTNPKHKFGLGIHVEL